MFSFGHVEFEMSMGYRSGKIHKRPGIGDMYLGVGSKTNVTDISH